MVGEALRMRSLFACMECKSARVKCGGLSAAACGRCARLGTPCVYAPRKKRGPQPWKKALSVRLQDLSRLTRSLDALPPERTPPERRVDGAVGAER